MNVVEITETEAFSAGSELWILKNNPDLKWWREIDYRSGFLLSQCLFHHKKNLAAPLVEILELTELEKTIVPHQKSTNLLLGSSDHFFNKWILLWNSSIEDVLKDIEKISQQQKTNSLRFFSNSNNIMDLMEARPKTSLYNITFIENT